MHHNCAYTLKCLSLHTHINIVPGDDVVGSLSRCENTIGAGSSYGSCELNSLLAIQDIRNIKKKMATGTHACWRISTAIK